MSDPTVVNVADLKLALTFYGISTPESLEELGVRYDEYVQILVSAVMRHENWLQEYAARKSTASEAEAK